MEFVILILIVVVFLGLPVMSMRKQSKQINEIKSFQATLEPGMIVQMTSGIHARIADVGETTVDVELAPGVTTTWDRSAVLKLVEPLEPEEQPVGGTAASAEAGVVRSAEDRADDARFEDFDTVEPFENNDSSDVADRDINQDVNQDVNQDIDQDIDQDGNSDSDGTNRA